MVAEKSVSGVDTETNFRQQPNQALILSFVLFQVVSAAIGFGLEAQREALVPYVFIACSILAIAGSRIYRDDFRSGYYHVLYFIGLTPLIWSFKINPPDQQFFTSTQVLFFVFGFFGIERPQALQGAWRFVVTGLTLVFLGFTMEIEQSQPYFSAQIWILSSTILAPLLFHRAKTKGNSDPAELIKELESSRIKLREQEEQIATLKLERKNEDYQENRLLRVAVHDINNRVASLMNLNRLFEIKFKKMHEEGLLKYNEKLEEIANELKVFADNLVAPIHNPEHPQISLNKDFIEIKPLLESIVDELRPKAASKSISLNLIQTNKDLHLQADKTYLKVILRNLMNYAIKFSQINNQIIVSTSMRFNKVYIEVMDKARGIEKESLDRMFSFLPDNIEDKMEDTTKGIGLSVAKFLTERMEGQVFYESSVELGLHFSVVFDAVSLPPGILEDQSFSETGPQK
ncbi:MAG: sensor histidine kinase [Luteibaculum sp.]